MKVNSLLTRIQRPKREATKHQHRFCVIPAPTANTFSNPTTSRKSSDRSAGFCRLLIAHRRPRRPFVTSISPSGGSSWSWLRAGTCFRIPGIDGIIRFDSRHTTSSSTLWPTSWPPWHHSTPRATSTTISAPEMSSFDIPTSFK